MYEGFHFYNLAVMTLVRNKLTWEYSRLSSLPPLETFAKEALSRKTFPVESIGERDRRLYSQVGNRRNPIYTRNFLALLALFQEY